ncbi:MAG TPA: plastocyanin/azurin family copper-binding protein [Gaiellaceae bacterium]|nr:plastocyanin/azurin family copper-binding protein [Gaiellaceae bacterium]
MSWNGVSAALLAALALGGCGGDGADEAAEVAGATADATADSAAEGDTLHASVGPGFTISVAGGNRVEAGTYTLVVDDRSDEHNFHLTGPGVNVSTGVEEVGERSFEVTLEPGEYTFLCDPHAESMNGTLRVG